MSELLEQLWTPEMQAAFTVVIVVLAVLYVLSIVWTARDAYLRGTYWYLWGILALVPFIGVVAYLLLRPPLLKIDRDEQELEIALKQRQLRKYGECANCGYPVESDYILCPNCHQQLKNLCPVCNHALEPSWTVCPYCATPVSGHPMNGPSATRNTPRQRHSHTRTPQPRQATSTPTAQKTQEQATSTPTAQKTQEQPPSTSTTQATHAQAPDHSSEQ